MAIREATGPMLSHVATTHGPGTGAQDEAPTGGQSGGDRMIDRIGKMAEDSREQDETNIKDISPEERKRQEQMPRNTKKRVYEAGKDEL